MPELPEVEHARRILVRALDGDPILRAESLDPRVVPQGAASFAHTLLGARLERADRRGKSILVGLRGAEGTDLGLFVHLGMTGRFDVLDDTSPETPRFVRWWLETARRRLSMIDPRRLGRALAGPRAEVAARSGFDAIGPDALEFESGAALRARFRDRVGRLVATPIKHALMDQKRLAGLGNIQATEALFLANIHPERPASTLRAAEWDALARAIRESLARTLGELENIAEITYVNEGGSNPFLVYGRAGEPCPRCGTSLRRETLRGRGTYFCPHCQRPGRR